MEQTSKFHLDLAVPLTTVIWSPVRNPGSDLAFAVKSLRRGAEGVVNAVETRVLSDGRAYLGGAAPSIADYFLLEGVDRYVGYFGRDAVASLLPPRVAAHWERMRSRPRVSAFLSSDMAYERVTGGPSPEEKMQAQFKELWAAAGVVSKKTA